MARDSLGKLVGAVDKDRAGKFSKAVPGRSTETRKVCIACRRAAHPWNDRQAAVCPTCGGALVEIEGC